MRTDRLFTVALLSTVALAASACGRRNNTAANATAPAQQMAGQPAAAPNNMAAAPNNMGAAPTAPAAGGNALNTGGTPNFGVRQVAPGFTPDPMDVPVVAGGTLDARGMSLGAGCVGYVTSQPDFNIQLSAADTMLRLYVTSDTDTTLIVNDAAGGWHCNDDSHGGHNPTVDLRNAAPGLLNVWVGSYQSGVQAHGVLHITELDSNHP